MLILLGCSFKKGADCDNAATNVAKLARASLQADGKMGLEGSKASDAADRNRQESMLPALKEQLIQTCKTEEWSQRVRECVANAKSVGELVKCDPDKGSSTTRATPTSTKPASAPSNDDKPAPTTPQ